MALLARSGLFAVTCTRNLQAYKFYQIGSEWKLLVRENCHILAQNYKTFLVGKKLECLFLASVYSLDNNLQVKVRTHAGCGSSDFAERCNFNRNSPIFSNHHCWR